jgi:hypothetical protein
VQYFSSQPRGGLLGGRLFGGGGQRIQAYSSSQFGNGGGWNGFNGGLSASPYQGFTTLPEFAPQFSFPQQFGFSSCSGSFSQPQFINPWQFRQWPQFEFRFQRGEPGQQIVPDRVPYYPPSGRALEVPPQLNRGPEAPRYYQTPPAQSGPDNDTLMVSRRTRYY